MATITPHARIGVCLTLAQAIGQTHTVDELYGLALDALRDGLGLERASILLFDADGVMRFKAYRGLSEGYRRAVEGHTPWRPDSQNPQPIQVPDVERAPELAAYLPVIRSEGIGAMAFIPLVSQRQVVGKFMLYHDRPRTLDPDDIEFATLIASQVAFAVERTRAETTARRDEERLRFALDSASMGTWDWDLVSNRVRWSDNLERIHGLPPGTFDGSFTSYEREIHPDDRERVLASAQRAIRDGVPHDVEYRIVAPDGTVRWCEGKGRVEYEGGRAVRMTGVCMMVTARKEAERMRLAAAEEASRLKDEFLATLSHELRTPLNAVLGWVQMLQSGRLGPERVQQAIGIIDRNATLQARLIEDILDISRIIAGKLEIERLPLALSQVIDTVVTGARPEATARGLTLTVSVPPDLPPIEGDPKRLHQVFGNVVSNAIKFTPEGGCITIAARAAGDAVEIDIADTGSGIHPEFLPFVFERFRQGDSRATRQHGGLGLGLAIARHLIERHGGAIRASSPGVGGGTTMQIRLPRGAEAPKAGVPKARVPQAAVPTAGGPNAAAPSVQSEWRASREPGAAVERSFRLDGRRVLVVDDQLDSCELLATVLAARGADVVTCHNAASALDALQSGQVHLLVADIAMPDVDGLELVRRVRERQPDLPAVAVSAYARPEDRQRALLAGYRGYCTKPIDYSTLFRTLRDTLQPAIEPVSHPEGALS